MPLVSGSVFPPHAAEVRLAAAGASSVPDVLPRRPPCPSSSELSDEVSVVESSLFLVSLLILDASVNIGIHSTGCSVLLT